MVHEVCVLEGSYCVDSIIQHKQSIMSGQYGKVFTRIGESNRGEICYIISSFPITATSVSDSIVAKEESGATVLVTSSSYLCDCSVVLRPDWEE